MAGESRQTEIDSADDLFLGGDDDLVEEPSGAEPTETEQDDATSFDEAPPSAEIEEAEPEFEPEGDTEAQFEDAAGEKAPRKKKKGFPVLQYYVVPAVGVVLIMSLGWSFALIARRGLVRPPEEVAKATKVEKKDEKVEEKQEALIKPKRDLRTVLVPIQEEKEAEVKGQEGTFKANIRAPKSKKKFAPTETPLVGEGEADEASLPPDSGKPAGKALPPEVDTGLSLTVPVNHPFFIPLKGGRSTKAAITFLNFSLNLLVSTKAAASEFNSKRALIRELIYLHYSRSSAGDLSTPAGRDRVRRRLVAKLDKQLIHGKVRGVLFQEFYTR
ncbi:MAG: flagellar basal body-associated FliL family protein [Nitrospinaceae bacterium]|jgi:hypothetical protein|nr:flagellar basal body-associated FliL family protein [Nitrospinaceae bacterium]MBT3434559.1 flagellar basal body-associated FliL family protein [Nitrospinaceae bacterium]MBT4431980.1 flagellar basal body-associated FliL family protein [Nitrospinaceae bacterium]MBT5367537.1 flagellar basal body-associated FliL family protein [Nitrospinaceae bacterium]MBT5948323.1 flagellar basal body-associated FliL family protein [Nitrospinaceae bacterium]